MAEVLGGEKNINTHVFAIQDTESDPVAELCQAIREQNLLSMTQPAPICSQTVAAVEETPVVRKQLRVKLRLGDSNRLKMGLVDSWSGCNLLPFNY